MSSPVTNAIYACKNPLQLAWVLWQAKYVHWKHVAPNTQCQWQNACMPCAEYFMDTTPADANWVYNTVFTFLRDEQKEQRHTRMLRRLKQANEQQQIGNRTDHRTNGGHRQQTA